jgi:ATP-dependent RNA helicase RhlE
MPKEIEQLAAGILHDPAFVKVDPVSSTVERIDQSLYFVEKGNKKFLLPWLIKNLTPPVQNALVFSRTKHGADKIARDLTKQGITAAAIHGNKSQTARVAALEGFKEGKTRVLVATDIAARGIDISELSHVFNYDLPEVPETYVHRIGRTARAGADGTAVSFCAPEEMEYLAGIEKLNRRKIPVVSGHPWDGVPAPVKAAPPVRGRKPKAEQPAPEKAETPKAEKAARPAAPEKKSAARPSAAKKQKAPKIEAKEEPLMDDTKRTTGGRSNDRRSNNNSRPRREQNAPARGSNAQPKFDPHFVSAPEATPLRPAKKTPAAPAAPAIRTAAQPAQQNSSMQGQKSRRNDRSDRPARQNSQPAAQSQSAEQGRGANNGQRGRQNASRNAQPAPARAPRAESSRRGRAAAARDEDPGLMLISRRPPQQKFTNFEEYMNAHGGATAPIEDHSDEV